MLGFEDIDKEQRDDELGEMGEDEEGEEDG